MVEDRGQDALDIRLLKFELRRQMKKMRAAAFAQNKEASFQLRDQFLKALSFPVANIIGSYQAQGSEIDPSPLADALREKGHLFALPVIAHKDEPLSFRNYAIGDPLVPNSYGIGEPGPAALTVEPDILFVPLLAFNRQGSRLGTGAGYYDRTLKALRAKKSIFAIGLAFSCQEVDTIPIENHDAPLDRIATEIQVFNPPATVRA